jgi:hypothetical protein
MNKRINLFESCKQNSKKSVAKLILVLLSLSGMVIDTASAQDVLPLTLNAEWKVFLFPKEAVQYDDVPEKLASAKSGETFPKTVRLNKDVIDIAALAQGNFEEKDTALLFNEFTSDRTGKMKLGMASDYWMEVYVNGTLTFSTMASGNEGKAYTPTAFSFDMPVKSGKNLLVVKVLAGQDGWRFACGVPVPKRTKANVIFQENSDWKAVKMDDLFVKEGSALDQKKISDVPRPMELSPRSDGATAPRGLPRLGIGPTGKIIIQGHPDTTVRLHGTGSNTPWIFDKPFRDPNWKETWKREAVSARLQGYNIIRLWTDSIYKQDLNITPDQLDKFDYFTSILAEHGIYTFLTLSSYGVYLKTTWGPANNGERRDYKLRMYLGDEHVRQAWKYGVETIMNHVNAYTGVAWKDDPNIACAELFNEQEWGFLDPKSKLSEQTQLEFDAKYRGWLLAKYKTVEELSKTWNSPALASVDKIRTPESFPFKGKLASDNDYIQFCADLSRESVTWMRNTLRATGYKGLISQYNLSHWLAQQPVRWEESQVSIENAYHNHPTAHDNPGSKCDQKSSIGTGAWYWRVIASTRFADRPMMVTEYNHSFWNPYQYECGLLYGAYSALNGFDALLIHSEAVFSYAGKPEISIFNVGRSPVSRAGEFLLGCLYLRGDVKTSPHRVELQIPKEYIGANRNGSRSVSSEQGKMAFLTGFSVSFPWAKPAEGVGVAPSPDFILTPDIGGEIASAGGGWAISGKDSPVSKFSLSNTVKKIKENGMLPESNISDPEKGIFQSDTGEITMRMHENLLKVITSRSEAVALEGGKSEQLQMLNILKTSVPALVAACAVDGKSLLASKRVVLIFSTQVANSGMELSPDRTTMVNLGKLPILMKVGKLDVTLKNANSTGMSLYALGFDGIRREKIPMESHGGTLKIMIDSGSLKDGPTPFFELVAE